VALSGSCSPERPDDLPKVNHMVVRNSLIEGRGGGEEWGGGKKGEKGGSFIKKDTPQQKKMLAARLMAYKNRVTVALARN